MVDLTHVNASFEEPLPPAFAGVDPEAALAAVAASVARAGVSFGAADRPFKLDPVPRVIQAAEWEPLAAGLCQRVRALDRFVCDVYGRQRIIREGVIAATAVATAEYFEPLMQQAVHDERRYITIAGLDCVRGPDGGFRVLEDNVRTPSGISYAAAARAAVTECVDAPEHLADLDGAFDALGAALRDAAPDGVDDPMVAVLSDGPANAAFWDHRTIAARLGLSLVRLDDLRIRQGALHARTDDGELRVDVVYRRTDEDRLSHPRGGLTPVGRLLLEPWRRGRLGLVNAFGTGVADDKLLHAHVEDMIRFYLGEEPLVSSVKTYDLTEPGVLDRALERLDELVVKPRAGLGGAGVVLGPLSDSAQIAAAADALRAAPGEYVIQDFCPLSVHPTVVDGRLQARHVDLRPFVFYGAGEPRALPGGLTRVALGEGEMIVNSACGGGAKDTWVVG